MASSYLGISVLEITLLRAGCFVCLEVRYELSDLVVFSRCLQCSVQHA